MFGTIRRHSKWLWFVIVAVIIVSFVVYFDPSVQRSGGGGRVGELGEINGKLVTPQQLREAQQETRLLYFLNFRNWPEQDERAAQMGFDIEREAYLRLLRLAEAERAGIQVSDAAVGQLAKRLLGDFPPARFEQEVLQQRGLTLDDFERFVRHDVAIQQLNNLFGLAGRLVTPAEAEALYRRENQALAGDIVLFQVTNYISRVAITNGALTNYYAQQMARYRTPEKVLVSYVAFPASNYLADAEQRLAGLTNLNQELEQLYYRQGTNTFRDTNGIVLSREKALEQIREEQRRRLAMSFASRKANEFASKVYDEVYKAGDDAPARAPVLANVAASEGLPLQVTPPFEIQEGPTNLNLTGVSARLWASLSDTNAIVFQPLEGEHGFYVVALEGREPSRLQPFEAVADTVAADYRRSQAFTLIHQDATNFHARLTNGLAHGRTFSEVASELKLAPLTLPPISRATETLTNFNETINVRQLKNVMFSLEPGDASGFIPNPPDGGYVLYVRAKLPFDEEQLKTELPQFMAEMRYQKQNEVFGQWFRKQVEKAQATIPALNRPATPRGGIPPG